MADATQVVFTISVPTLAVLIGILVNNARLNDVSRRIDDFNRRIDDFRTHVDSRFSSTDSLFTERLKRVEEVMDARLKHLEES